jgi:hypothetical protein
MSQFPALWGHGAHVHAFGGWRNMTLLAIQIVLCVVFLVMGIATLLNLAAIRPSFEMIGLGSWFRYFTGFLEILAALMLVSPMGLAGLGGLLAMCVMAGTIIAQSLWPIGGSQIVTLIVLLLAAIVAWERHELWTRATPPPPSTPAA